MLVYAIAVRESPGRLAFLFYRFVLISRLELGPVTLVSAPVFLNLHLYRLTFDPWMIALSLALLTESGEVLL